MFKILNKLSKSHNKQNCQLKSFKMINAICIEFDQFWFVMHWGIIYHRYKFALFIRAETYGAACIIPGSSKAHSKDSGQLITLHNMDEILKHLQIRKPNS